LFHRSNRHVVPNFIGEGIPLMAPRHRDIVLRLLSTKKYPDGVVEVRYEVARQANFTIGHKPGHSELVKSWLVALLDISDNVGPVKHFLSRPLPALKRVCSFPFLGSLSSRS
jgi:hypothetical protein